MELTTDVLLHGESWKKAADSLKTIFPKRPFHDIYILAMAIGIMYDQRCKKNDDNGADPLNVPRNVLRNNDNGRLDLMFQAAILSTKTETMSEDDRLSLAFGDRSEFKKMDLLTEFANFGVTKLVEQIGNTPIETMENIKNFLSASVEGRNFEIDALSDDILLDDI